MRKPGTWVGMAALGLVALTLNAAPARADEIISLSDGVGNSVTIADQSAADLNPLVGSVTFAGTIGAFMVNVTTGISKPILGSAALPELDLASVDITGGAGGGTLTILLTDTNFTGTGGQLSFVNTVGGTQRAGGVTFTTFLDSSNTQFGQGTPLATQTFATTAFSGTSGTSASVPNGPYSVTEEAVLTLPGAFDTTSFDSNLTAATIPVPEPSSLLLLGTGLLCVGPLLRRRKPA